MLFFIRNRGIRLLLLTNHITSSPGISRPIQNNSESKFTLACVRGRLLEVVAGVQVKKRDFQLNRSDRTTRCMNYAVHSSIFVELSSA